jgi:hypothetical protein
MAWNLSNIGDSTAKMAIPIIVVLALVGGVASSLTGGAATAANEIATSLGTAVSTYFPLVLTFAFLLGIYGMYLATQGKKGKGKG